MTYTSVFERHELKYILTRKQASEIKRAIGHRLQIDEYGPTTIRNIYFDTDDFRIIRRSLDKPVYKAKLRIRSYRRAEGEDPVFVEIKKKYNGKVYKRRVEAMNCLAMDWIAGFGEAPDESQIAKEITYYRNFYQDLHPKVFVSYKREAYVPVPGNEEDMRHDLRVTFDTDILGRQKDLSFSKSILGQRILSEDKVLMEIKISDSIPLWLVKVLSENKIRKQSFSKYGKYYIDNIKNKEESDDLKGGLLYA